MKSNNVASAAYQVGGTLTLTIRAVAGGGSVVLEWSSAADRRYTLWGATNLATGSRC